MLHAIGRMFRGRRDEGRSRGGGVLRFLVTLVLLALFGPTLLSYFLRVIGVPHWFKLTVMIAAVAGIVGLVVHFYSRILREWSSHRHALKTRSHEELPVQRDDQPATLPPGQVASTSKLRRRDWIRQATRFERRDSTVSGFNVIGGAAAVAGLCLVGAALIVAGAVYGLFKILQGSYELALAAHGALKKFQDRRHADSVERMQSLVPESHSRVESIVARAMILHDQLDGAGSDFDCDVAQRSLDELLDIQDELASFDQQERLRQRVMATITYASPTVSAAALSHANLSVTAFARRGEVASKTEYTSPALGRDVEPQRSGPMPGPFEPRTLDAWIPDGSPSSSALPGAEDPAVAAEPRKVSEMMSRQFGARVLLYEYVEKSGIVVQESDLRDLESMVYECETSTDVAKFELKIQGAIERGLKYQAQLDKDRQRAVECLNNLDVVDTINEGPTEVTAELRSQLEPTLSARQLITEELAERIDDQITAALRTLIDRDITCINGAGAIEVRTQYREGWGVVTTVTPTSFRPLTKSEQEALDKEACHVTESLITRYKEFQIDISVRQESGVGMFLPASRAAKEGFEDQVHVESQKRRRDHVQKTYRTMKHDPRR